MHNFQDADLLLLLPSSLTHDRQVQAMAAAVNAPFNTATQAVKDVSIIPRIREIDHADLIDLLAWQFHVDFYDQTLPIDVRRELVIKSLDWHARKGTPRMVEEVVSTVFDHGEIAEWFEYGGEPYFFRIYTDAPLRTPEEYRYFFTLLETVKRKSAWLDRIVVFTRSTGTLHAGSYTFITHLYQSPPRGQLGG